MQDVIQPRKRRVGISPIPLGYSILNTLRGWARSLLSADETPRASHYVLKSDFSDWKMSISENLGQEL
jgi:hypothetical protein